MRLLFIIVKQVRGGGQWRGEHLGKVVRWFWGIGGSELTYKSTGHKIPSSDGAIPCMELPFDVSLINIDRYVHEAEIIIVKMEGCLQLQGL